MDTAWVCRIAEAITISAVNNATVSSLIWRFRVTYLDGRMKYLMDKDAPIIIGTFPATAENPIIQIYAREAYITDGSYDQIQVVRGEYTADTMPPYTPYHDGGQAQAPELWAIPGTDYRDEWDPQTGRGIRRVKKLVLDGAEAWVTNKQNDYKICIYFNARFFPPLPALSGNGVCTHFPISYEGATVISSGWNDKLGIATANTTGCVYMSLPLSVLESPDLDGAKAYLAQQYADGTPVTLLTAYDSQPFATDPQPLTQPTGYGQIIQTSGDVPDCPFTARYLTHR